MTATQTTRDSEANENVDGWLTPGKFALLLAALIIACFPKVVFGFETFFYRDFGAFAYPLAFYHREAFWHGEMPLWNPSNFCGLPFLAQWNTLTLYPPSLFYLLFPLSWSLGMFNLLHMFWAGLGMYFLAHRWTGNRLAASVAGLVFAFNGLSWYALMWSNNIAALGWMPWVVLSVEQAWKQGGARRIVMAALAGAMQILTGAPEVIILTWFALGVFWLAEWVVGATARGWMILRMLGVGGLVAGLTAVQLLPFVDLLRHSQRDAGFGDSQWSMPLSGWANYLVPLFHTTPGAHGVFSQEGQYWTASYYLGVGTVALALLSIWQVRERRTYVLAGLAVFSLTMSLGDAGVVYTVVKKIFPVMGFMRFPIKFVVLATFVVPLLAAQAVGWWQSLPKERCETERKKLWWVGGLLLAAMAFIIWREWHDRSPAADNMSFATRNALVRVVFLVGLLGYFTLLRRANSACRHKLASICLLSLFWFDVSTHAPNLSPTIQPSVYGSDVIRQYHVSEKDPQWSDRLQLDAGRAMLTVGALSKMTFQSTESPESDVFGRRLSLWSNFNLLDHAPKFDGFFSLNMRHTSRLVTQVYLATNNGAQDMPALKDFLGISEITRSTNAMDWIARDNFLPLITAGQQPVFAEDDTALREMMGSKFDPARFTFLPPDARPFITVTNQTSAKIVSQDFHAQRLTAQVDATAPSLVVVAQSYYHPWHAYVDDRPTRLFRANYAFQALEIPAGRHVVKLIYEDRLFQVGAALSLISLALCLIFLLRARRGEAPPASRLG